MVLSVILLTHTEVWDICVFGRDNRIEILSLLMICLFLFKYQNSGTGLAACPHRHYTTIVTAASLQLASRWIWGWLLWYGGFWTCKWATGITKCWNHWGFLLEALSVAMLCHGLFKSLVHCVSSFLKGVKGDKSWCSWLELKHPESISFAGSGSQL